MGASLPRNTRKDLSDGGSGGMVDGMDDDAARPLTDKELAEEIRHYEWIARARYRSRKPGHDYHEWADKRDDAVARVKRLKQIQENREIEKTRRQLASGRLDQASELEEDIPKRTFEEWTGITLEELLREHMIERGHQPG